ncbi:MAG TPA: ElyC/SanA/YdcF family protein, partial [Methylomirabilota bacterium]|nr:ElyC/SanA/YdcF family protein [Methylomirabilota bacterium]
RGVQSILLVSSPLHLVRARQVFERQGFEVHPAPVEDVLLRAQRPGARLAVARAVVKELVGLLYYRLAGYL